MSKWISKLLGIVEKDRISERSLQTRILVSVFCIMICMAAMLSSAYAWFVVSVNSDMSVLNGANYLLEVTEKSGNVTRSVSEIYGCELACNDEYYFTLTSGGTASKGYCEIIVTDPDGEIAAYYTPVIPNGTSLDVCIQAANRSLIEFAPMWGAYEAQAVYSLRRPTTFNIQHSTTPHIEYLVVAGVTLEDLAEYYGVSIGDICTYNGISELEIGEVIKIPGIEDDSIEPYQPQQAGAATPSNATPSNGTPVTTESASAAESASALESTSAAESESALESTSAAESESASESASAAETEPSTESTSAAETDPTTESASASETDPTTENTSVAETESSTENTLASESEASSENTSAAESASSTESTSAAEPAPASEGGDQPIQPDMSTEDIEGSQASVAVEASAETGASPETSL